MTPIQQMYLGVGASEKTYIEDLFKIQLYTGNATARSINTGIDLSGKGGLVWTKNRDQATSHRLFDTERGINKEIRSNSNNAEATDVGTVTAFNNNGFSLGTDDGTNWDTKDYASWSFRRASGFFDIVKWDGDSTSGREIAHQLGSVPGCILVKCTSNGSTDWRVYHRDTGNTKALGLNTSSAAATNTAFWNDISPTSTHFTVGNSAYINDNNKTYVGYLFAGGESGAATARSVDFDRSNDCLTLAATSDFNFGTDDFTIEYWFNTDDVTGNGLGTCALGSYSAAGGFELYISGNNLKLYFHDGTSGAYRIETTNKITDGIWNHAALVRSGNIVTLYINGNNEGTYDATGKSFGTGTNNYFTVGASNNGSPINFFGGKLSNFRIVKGTAVYTSSFRPSTEPLTNITNTKLLCCNNASTTGSTTTPGTITAVDSPTASTDSPFDDPTGFVFGDAEDQNVIKCGSYIGNGSTAGPEIILGWAPQYLLIKNSEISDNWFMFDSTRGFVGVERNNAPIVPDEDWVEQSQARIKITSTGFKCFSANGDMNGNNQKIIFVAIRRPDGYCGKPIETATDAFFMGARSGSGSNALSNVNGFVDFSIIKRKDTGEYWATNARMMGDHSLKVSSTTAEFAGALPTTTDGNRIWDHMAGHLVNAGNGATNSGSDICDYGWKRHAGFDCLCFDGNGVAGKQIPHSLSKIPEMLMVKCRSHTEDWRVYHKGSNGGTDPEDYYLSLNGTAAEIDSPGMWNDTAPTSTHFTVGSSGAVNDNGRTYFAMLFTSIDKISKVGYYTGSSGSVSLDLGFSPRFIFIKRRDGANSWMVFDTLRGIPAGNDPVLMFNSDSVQDTSDDYLDVTSSGVTIHNIGENSTNNGSSMNYIYYAHA